MVLAAILAGAEPALAGLSVRGAVAGAALPSPGGSSARKCSSSLRELLAATRAADTIAVWIYLADRGTAARAGDAPCLSARAAHRRVLRGNASVGSLDLPVQRAYVDSLRDHAARIRHVSRYFNAVSAEMEAREIEAVCEYGFVRSVDLIAAHRRLPDPTADRARGSAPTRAACAECSLDYGASFDQLNLVGVIDLLEEGYNGSGSISGGDPVLIAILDTGFRLDHAALADVRVEAQYDFVNNDSVTSNQPGDPANQDMHGTTVLGVIAGHAEGDLIGPAWGARYLLAKTEIVGSETPIEEDNWVAGIEWADSAGADVVTSSLGYFDWYTRNQFDGNTALCTRAADIAASHGIVVVNSVGNEGISGLVAPADGDSVFAIGAVDRDGVIASFSSRGPTTDGRIKPDFTAMGVGVRSVALSAGYGSYNGTSYAAPIVAGVFALLLEIHPEWSPMEMQDTLRATSSRSSTPDNTYGWGIPYAMLTARPAEPVSYSTAYPNPFSIATTIYVSLRSPRSVTVRVHDCRGSMIKSLAERRAIQRSLTLSWDGTNERGDRVASGVYFLAIGLGGSTKTIKAVLIR
ncbi:MAG: S8 family serine peptidase [Candidatus Krumholzibacteria bacterium]|nr:S8 family serine peptidase [Candidatus Krumholzibacteria bacterium]